MAKRYLAWVLGTFAVSLFILTFIPLKSFWIAAICLIAALIPLLFIRLRFKKTVVSCFCAAMAAIILLGFVSASAEKIQKRYIGKNVEVEGVITEIGTNTAQTMAVYTVKVDRITNEDVSFLSPFYINVYCDETNHTPGEILKGTISVFETPVKFGFGREDRVFLSGIQAEEQLSFFEKDGFSPYKVIYTFKTSISQKIHYASENTNGLIKGICLGDKAEIDPSLCIALKNCGLTHVTAVSGLHLAFATMLFGFMFILLQINYRIRYIVGIFSAIFFTIAVGAPLSCVRACVMFTIFSLGMALDWFSDALTSISIAAFLILVINPLAIRDIGFLLSICATIGIIVASGPIEYFLFPKKLGKHYRLTGIYRAFTRIFAASIAAILFTLPIMAVAFGSVSIIAPLANLLLIYPVQGLFILGMLTALLEWIPFMGILLGWVSDVLYSIIDVIAKFLGRLPFSTINKIDALTAFLIIAFLCTAALSIFSFIRRKERIFFRVFALFLCFAFVSSSIYFSKKPADQLKIAFVDMGQGSCTILSKGSRAVVFDCGGTSSKRYNVIDYIRSQNIDQVELLAFTHLHNDHINGTNLLLNNVFVCDILYPQTDFSSPEMFNSIAKNGSPITENHKRIVLDDVTIEVIANAVLQETEEDWNENCVCYRIVYGSTAVLVTGDLPGGSEMKLLDNNLSCTILNVGHHGSEKSSFYPFLKAAAPEYSIISVGKNGYGLPDPQTIARIETLCPNIYTTQSDGTILFKTDGQIIERISK